MSSVAILKHIAVRNSDYGEIQRYLLFEHDPVTGKPIFDDQGQMVMRKQYIQTGLNCDPFTFNTECHELNYKYQKNQEHKDVKSHHYIISFDPRDRDENGLTPERVQAIGVEFAKKFFAGHQALIVTHTDGHNHAGNLHCHICFNSLRKETVPWQSFMERPHDAVAGYKHHQTRQLLRYMQEELNRICEREHLHTVDFATPAEKKTTDREYWAIKRGQQRLDEAGTEGDIFAPISNRPSFETIKDQLRAAIEDAARRAHNEEEFIRIMQEDYHCSVRLKRGVYSYQIEGHEKPIRGRNLGSLYNRDNILQQLGKDSLHHEAIPIEFAELPPIFLIHSDLRLVVDLQTCVKAQQSIAYARKVTISNIQQMADTVSYIQKNGIASVDKLQEAYKLAEDQYATASKALEEMRSQIRQTNEAIHYLGIYLSHKSTYKEFLSSRNKALFRSRHATEITEYEDAVKRLKDMYPEGKHPSIKDLKEKKAQLVKLREKQEVDLAPYSEQHRTMQIVTHNVSAILGRNIIERQEEQL